MFLQHLLFKGTNVLQITRIAFTAFDSVSLVAVPLKKDTALNNPRSLTRRSGLHRWLRAGFSSMAGLTVDDKELQSPTKITTNAGL